MALWSACRRESPEAPGVLYEQRMREISEYRSWQRSVLAKRRSRPTAWANAASIRAVYAEARRLTEQTGVPHEVDHLYSVGLNENVCGLHVENNLRVVEATVNRRKQNMLPGCLQSELWNPFGLDVFYDNDYFASAFQRRKAREKARREYETRLAIARRRRQAEILRAEAKSQAKIGSRKPNPPRGGASVSRWPSVHELRGATAARSATIGEAA